MTIKQINNVRVMNTEVGMLLLLSKESGSQLKKELIPLQTVPRM